MSSNIIQNTKSFISSEIEKKDKVDSNLIISKDMDEENKYIKELFQNLQKFEKRDQTLMELTKLKDSQKNIAIYIFYSSSTITIL
jgi:hypothetical protein